MTEHQKRSIEISDILAFCFTCNQCGSSLSIPVSGDMKRGKLYTCPNCDTAWLSQNEDAVIALANLTKYLSSLGSIVRTWANRPEGFRFSFEIASDPVSTGKG
jgi:predicted RNA-binding Zn-ribbon protein involved in translation (DUF1610 family)